MNAPQPLVRGRRRRVTAASVLLSLLTAAGIVGTAPGAAAQVTAITSAGAAKAPNRAMDTVGAMQPSWNLGNTLDAIPDETSWGNPPVTKALFDRLRTQGFHSARIPVTWSGHQSASAPCTIDSAFLVRVRQVVDWALSDGLYVDWHRRWSRCMTAVWSPPFTTTGTGPSV